MGWVTRELLDVWKRGQFVGEHTPTAVVQVQLGHWVRGWWEWDGPPVKASIWGEGGYGPPGAWPGKHHWWPKWVHNTPWYDLPNLVSIKRTKDLAQANGVQVLEVVLDAVDYVPKVGALGDAYHAIAPGWLAPSRNFVGQGRARQPWQQPDQLSEWAPEGQDPRITDSVAIRVWQGFGQPETDEHGNTPAVDGGSNGAWVFRGMIDDVDVDGDPNQITITARNGKLLTDQRVFRAAKAVTLRDPITFYDREAARKEVPVAACAQASSSSYGHPPALVLDRARNDYDADQPAYKTGWKSDTPTAPKSLEWIDIRLSQGRYDQLFIVAPAGQLAYVGIYARPLRHWTRETSDSDLVLHTSPATKDGEQLSDGWVGHRAVPKFFLPGEDDWQYVHAFKTGSTRPDLTRGESQRAIDVVDLGSVYELGDHSKLRIGIVATPTKPVSVNALFGLRRYGVQRDIVHQQFILVDDATEIVKVVLRWAGFKEWDVEDAMVRLSDGTNYGPGVVAKSSGRLTFNRGNYLIDIINALAKELGWVFFIADPTDANSDGVPTFRRDSSLLTDKRSIAAELTSRTMLTGVKTKVSDENRPYIIRVRGKTATARGGGLPLGGDSLRRLNAAYFPPWAFGGRAGGILRHMVYTDDQLVTYAQCLYGCLLTALNAAVAMHTAVVEIPGHPGLELDDQVSVIDEPTGVNSRLWVTNIADEMQLGQNASWKATVQGALLDTRDMQDVIDQMRGRAPVAIGANNTTKWLRRIDWRHVINPATGHITSYRPPSQSGKRDLRIR